MRGSIVATVALAIAGAPPAEEATPDRTEDQLEASGVATQTVCTLRALDLGPLGADELERMRRIGDHLRGRRDR